MERLPQSQVSCWPGRRRKGRGRYVLDQRFPDALSIPAISRKLISRKNKNNGMLRRRNDENKGLYQLKVDRGMLNTLKSYL